MDNNLKAQIQRGIQVLDAAGLHEAAKFLLTFLIKKEVVDKKKGK